MNLNCANCEDTLLSYLSDLPLEWRSQIVHAICEARDLECGEGCDGINGCETLSSLSSFKRTGTTISIVYKSEDGKEHVRNFDFSDILNNSLNNLDPKCILPKNIWDTLTLAGKMQAILDYDCGCCTTTTSSTSTTTKNPCDKKFSIHNHSISDIPFEIRFKDSLSGNYVLDKTTPAGGTTYYDYTSSQNPSEIFIKHTPLVSVTVSILVDGEEFLNFIQDVGAILATDIPPCKDIAVIITTGNVTTVTTTSTTSSSTTSTTTATPTTTTTTTRIRRSTTTTTTQEAYCHIVTGIQVSAGLPEETTTTTTTEPPIPCGAQTQYEGGEAFPAEVDITLGSGVGQVTLYYNAFGIPDKFILIFDGQEVINTGYRGDAAYQGQLTDALALRDLPSEPIIPVVSGSVSFVKTSAATTAKLLVYAPIENTGWEALVSCPNGEGLPPTTSSTSTSTTTVVDVCPDVTEITWNIQ